MPYLRKACCFGKLFCTYSLANRAVQDSIALARLQWPMSISRTRRLIRPTVFFMRTAVFFSTGVFGKGFDSKADLLPTSSPDTPHALYKLHNENCCKINEWLSLVLTAMAKTGDKFPSPAVYVLPAKRESSSFSRLFVSAVVNLFYWLTVC